MALIKCPECGKEVSDRATTCPNCGNPINENTNGPGVSRESPINTEIKRATYKLESDDAAGAEEIFEKVAITHDIPAAWIYLGAIKLSQLDIGKSKVQQALNCFTKASGLLPNAKTAYQAIYYDLSLRQIERFCAAYLETVKQGKQAKRGKLWDLALLGLSVGIGNQRSNRGNSTFQGAAGVAGAVYALNRMNKKTLQFKEKKDLLFFLDETIRQLIKGVNAFCADNEALNQEFAKRVAQILTEDEFKYLRQAEVPTYPRPTEKEFQDTMRSINEIRQKDPDSYRALLADISQNAEGKGSPVLRDKTYPGWTMNDFQDLRRSLIND